MPENPRKPTTTSTNEPVVDKWDTGPRAHKDVSSEPEQETIRAPIDIGGEEDPSGNKPSA